MGSQLTIFKNEASNRNYFPSCFCAFVEARKSFSRRAKHDVQTNRRVDIPTDAKVTTQTQTEERNHKVTFSYECRPIEELNTTSRRGYSKANVIKAVRI